MLEAISKTFTAKLIYSQNYFIILFTVKFIYFARKKSIESLQRISFNISQKYFFHPGKNDFRTLPSDMKMFDL